MDYLQARAYIEESMKYGSVLGLDNMNEMCQRLGNPQKDLKAIHIAGTNGKGSVLAYTSTILKEAGYLVGRYISPTLFSYRGRIQLNGEPISKEDFAVCVEQVAGVIETMVADGLAHPTPFEIETMVSFVYFKMKKCDFIVMECGMGGLLDATNVLENTQVAVLTPISMDHMSFLGNTLEEIAENKAGIIVPGCSVVTGAQQKNIYPVIEKISERFKCPLAIAKEKQTILIENTLERQRFLYPKDEKEKRQSEDLGGLSKELFEITLAGSHQIENATIAIEVIYALQERGFAISMEQIKKGLANTTWEGRFTVIHKAPYVIIDGAHNPAAAWKLRKSLETYFPGKNLYYIMGVFADKDYEQVLEITAGLAKEIYTIQTPENDRALSAAKLATAARKYHDCVKSFANINKAVDTALKNAKEEDVIIAFGSLSFLGRIKAAVNKEEIIDD